ncbi:MAG: GGDEF domain-containing protein [Planctomycetes bacterium]|nr:GGDEF domain-containing protein [Planctomycetota bacterium]MCB9935217.1 GGDEF domain-containing protein [Planctomycetota bacterium]
MPTHNTALWRSTYLLGVALLLPIGTIVLVTYYFARMNPFAPEVKSDPWAFAIIAMAGGLSALMATLLALFASATYRARVRFEAEYRQLQRYLNEDVARDRTRLIRNLDLVSAAQQVSMAIKQETDFERILSVVLEQLEHFARSDSITVFTIDEHGKPAARAERRHGADRFPPALTQDSVECSLVEEAVRLGRQARELNETTGEFVLAVYFGTPEGVRGVVRIARNVADEPDFSDEMPAYEQAVGQLVRMVSLGLKTASMWDRAIKDEKTGLYNANHYQDQMKRQVAIAQRTGAPLSLIMLDVDKFKHINDTYGHLAGDTVLSEISAILKREARESDTPYRYGGEELCIVCCGTSEEDAAKAAERMRHKIACTEFHDDRGRLLPISASFGVAEFDPAHMHSEKDLKEACDRALYVAKENGRNLVVVHAGAERFHKLERSGDPNKEVKRRLGLAGDNSPLDGDRDPAPITDEKQASARALLGESIDKLATGLVDVVGNDSDRARVVDTVVREAAEFLTRNLSARLGEEPGLKRAAPKPEPAEKPKRKRARRKAPAMEQPAIAQHDPEPAPKPKRRRKTKKEKQAEEAAAALKKLQAEEDAQLSADSDRLDYLTDDEGEQLARGEAPSKRLRKAARKAG